MFCHKSSHSGQTIPEVIILKYEHGLLNHDSNPTDYFNALPSEVQMYISARIDSLHSIEQVKALADQYHAQKH